MALAVEVPVQAATYEAHVNITGCTYDDNGSETVPAATDVIIG